MKLKFNLACISRCCCFSPFNYLSTLQNNFSSGRDISNKATNVTLAALKPGQLSLATQGGTGAAKRNVLV